MIAKNFKTIIFLAFLITFTPSCSRRIITGHIGNIDENKKVNGIFYALPQTRITVDVQVTKTEHIKGPYHAFAGKFLGLSNVINNNHSTYEISDIKIGHYVEPDSSQYYFIRPNKFSLRKKSVFINLSESGLLKSINDINEWSDLEKADYTFIEKEAEITDETFNYLVDDNLFEKIDTLIEKIHLDTITIEKHTLRKSLVEKDDEQKAKDVADYILNIKEKKLNIISGFNEVPYDKNTIEYMYARLDKLENEYLLLFTGIKTTKTNTYRFTYLPSINETKQPIPLFNFSIFEGLLDATSLKGDEFFLYVEAKGNSEPLKKLFTEHKPAKRSGIFYRMPEYGKVSLISKNKVKAEATLIINQFGVVNQIPPSKIKLQFYPNSGAVKSIGLE